ncbi:MAG: putative transporter, substrate-binding protein [Ilumatobacteraceae bacterium]|nr:putative transporter, substrate-binding protein [Ilumatobacteraceae bacterium]
MDHNKFDAVGMTRRSTTHAFNRRGLVTALAVGSLIAAACGSDKAAAPTTSAAAATTAAPTTAAAATTATPATTEAAETTVAETDAVTTDAPTTDAPTTTEAPATTTTKVIAPASGEPVTIGFISMLDGPLAQPQMGEAAKAAVAYINESLGGVGGRPLALDICSADGSPDTSAKCANQFVTDKVPVVFQGLDFGNAALHPILDQAGIPFVGQHPFTAPDYQSGYFFSGSQVAYGLGAGIYLRDQVHPKKVTIISYSLPSAKAATEAYIKPAMEATGAEVSTVEFDYGTPDLSTTVAAAIADNPDVLISFIGDADCTKLVNASSQLGYKGMVIAGSCGDFLRDSGTAAEGVYAMSDTYSPDDLTLAPDRPKAEVEAYVAAMGKYSPDSSLGVFTAFVFAGIMNLHAILDQIGPDSITSDSVRSALEASKDEPAYMADTYGCAGELTSLAPSVCGANVLMLHAEGGKFKQVSPTFLFGPSLLG